MKSKSDRAIVEAVELGYTADEEGNIYSPTGRKLSNRSRKKSGHISVTLKLKGFNERGSVPVLAHRLVAYYFFGKEMFENECVRHLNDVPWDNRLKNLALGSMKENRSDIPREIICSNAKKHAHKLVSRSRKLTDQDILDMRAEREDNNTPYYKLGPMFGVTAMTAYRAVTKQSWKDVNKEG